jgi:dGTP triphosphohydrolase
MESELITRFINNPRIPEAFSGACPRLKVDDSVSAEVSILKALNWYYVIESPALKTQQFGLRKIVRDLFAVYADSPDEKLCPSWVAAELEENASPAR